MNLQDKTLVGYNSVPPSYSPLPPCLPPSVLLFQQQPHSSAPHAYTGASLCNAGSFLVFRSHKKKCRREGEMHMRRHQSMSCGTIGGFFFLRCHAYHITLWFLLLASSIHGVPGLSGQPNEWEMEQNDTWRLATTGQVRRTHGHDR